MTEDQKRLLAAGIAVLPDELNHATYLYLLEALLVERPAKEVRLYCRCDGGDSRSAFAIVDLIAQHGNVVGLLVGEADSAAVPIFAACQQRFVSAHGALGLHKVSWDGSRILDSESAALLAKDYENAERVSADLLAGISGQTSDYWYSVIQSAHGHAVKLIESGELIARGMAQPLHQLDAKPLSLAWVSTMGSR